MTNSFNCAVDYFPYPGGMVSTPELPFIPLHARWFGGSCSEEYKFNSDYPRLTPNVAARDIAYSKYKRYNKRNNYIWPFLKMITKDLTQDATVQWVVPVMNSYIGTNRAELLANYKNLDTINNLQDLQNSNFSATFKATVQDVVDTYFALTENRVTIICAEIGNEHYSDDGGGALNFLGNYDRLIWSRTNNTQLALTIYGKLCAMMIRILKSINPVLKCGVPLPEQLTGGFKQWASYFLNPEQLSNYDFVIFHLYAPNQNTSDPYTAYKGCLTYWNNAMAYIQNVVLPLIGTKQISVSEFSSSENNICLRGNSLDGDLYAYVVGLMKTIPNITSNHFHAFSNGVGLNVAIRMNGSTASGKAVLLPVGIKYLGLQK